MTTFVPDAATLLQATTDYFEQELLPTLEGYHRFQTRVSINVLRTVLRELQQRSALESKERQRLVQLLGHEGELTVLNAELATAIAAGSLPLNSGGLLEHLRLTLRDTLAINNPKWIVSDPKSTTPTGH
ncbi:MAG: DUF6285 domain-containing protein [Sulfuricaulis sp.]|nr:DUF6285 domain-containing protein [Sulfuricaulis sp.]